MQVTVEVDRNGRILVPAEFRRAYNWQPGAKVTLQPGEGGSVILMTKKDRMNKALKKVRRKAKKMGGVEEFLKFRQQDQE
jgi:AbrB family looped-hinge helix DNA binding protein